MSNVEAPIWSMQGAKTFPVNFGHTLPSSTNRFGRLCNLRFIKFGSPSLISATLQRHLCWLYLGTSWHKFTFRVSSTREEAQAKKEGVMPDFNAERSTWERKEIFLIKWRVGSYLYSSWELHRDMEKFDPTGTTSKIKLRRYVQAQEALFGIKWKRIVDKQRT